MRNSKSYNKSVFINCPFDKEYKKIFHAIVFTVIRLNFYPRNAEEESDGSEIRLNKIFRMIEECRFSIHDLSRTQLDFVTKLPRFNMPFELGLFLAAKKFGNTRKQLIKNCLIMEKNSHDYEKFLSDIKGQDIFAHNDKPKEAIRKVREWLRINSRNSHAPGSDTIWEEYNVFLRWLPERCKTIPITLKELTFTEYAQLTYEWIENDLKK